MIKSCQQAVTSTQFYMYGRSHFTQKGWERARKTYSAQDLLRDPSLSLNNRIFIVTGANAGIGRCIARFLAQRGAVVYMFCRSQIRGEQARKALSQETQSSRIHLVPCDVSLEASVRKAYATFYDHVTTTYSAPQLHGLVCNAGALLNERTLTTEGLETTFAAHLLLGSYLLTKLCLPVLKATEEARVVYVSSGGMYNTRFPEWPVATGRQSHFDGQLAYAYAKRGQVLLAEYLSKQYPEVAFVSCHPGWTDTSGVEKAYGTSKKYLMPMRSVWQGSEGIIWLCCAPSIDIESGAFYLDRKPQRKHLSGLFFRAGSFTQNTPTEVAHMVAQLEKWSSKTTRPALTPDNYVLSEQLLPSNQHVDIEQFMGRWFVWAHIPTYIDKGTTNNIEDYYYDLSKKQVHVRFTYSHAKGKKPNTLEQRAQMANPHNTVWKLALKLGVYIPLSTRYVIMYVDPDYEHTIVGVPDRSLLYIMGRSKSIDTTKLCDLLNRAEQQGYDLLNVQYPPFDPAIPDPAPFLLHR